MKAIIIPVRDVGFQPKLDKVVSQESVELLKCFELRKVNASVGSDKLSIRIIAYRRCATCPDMR
jgi:hypothetical protein